MSVDLSPDEDELAIQSSLAGLCREFEVETLAKTSSSEFPGSFWQALCEFGLFSVGMPGSDTGLVALTTAGEELGRNFAPGPLAAGVFGVQCLKSTELEDVLAGTSIVSLSASGIVPWPEMASILLSTDGNQVYRHPATMSEPVMKTLGDVPCGRVSQEPVVTVSEALRAIVAWEIFTAAYLSGGAQRLLDDASEYAVQRRQFGKSIAEFQAVSHPLATCAIKIRASSVLTRIAADRFECGHVDGAGLAGSAFLSARRGAAEASYAAHQCFGALGVAVDGPVFYATRRLRQAINYDPVRMQRSQRLEMINGLHHSAVSGAREA